MPPSLSRRTASYILFEGENWDEVGKKLINCCTKGTHYISSAPRTKHTAASSWERPVPSNLNCFAVLAPGPAQTWKPASVQGKGEHKNGASSSLLSNHKGNWEG